MMCFDVLIFLQLKDTTVSIGLVIGSETSAVFCEYVGERFDLGTFWVCSPLKDNAVQLGTFVPVRVFTGSDLITGSDRIGSGPKLTI